ncbi:MAG: aspartate/glutamate racemase family protein [Burkholderiaceae bacterium]
MRPPAHIGIVACSAEGASLCYRTICSEGYAVLAPHAHPEISLHSLSLADYVKCLDAGDLQGVADLMLTSANKLAAAGAKLLICPDNTIHQAFSLVRPESPLPWLHIAEVVASEAAALAYRRVGLLGTNWLMSSNVYPEKLRAEGIECIRPVDSQCDELGKLIMDELVRGIFHDSTKKRFQQIIQDLRDDGCEAVILGCTEIPLIINAGNSPLPTLDSTQLLARAALQAALEHSQ